jgi:DNA-binding CsgD family transcriptional regulator/tetratricopeptide (TPR) repeat protein
VLLDRADELAECDALLASVREGRGAVLLVEAGAGMGKTTLLAALRDRAREADMAALYARAGQLERDFAFGAARQLLEPVLAAAAPERVAELTAGSARHALAVLADAPEADPADAETDLRALHGLYWLVANLTEERPLVLVVDDAHWADVPSLRFLTYLARRAEELPVLIAAGARPETRPEAHELLDELADDPLAHVLRPRPLSVPAVAELVRAAYEQAPEEPFAAEAARVTAGNPFYVRELMRAARDADIAPVAAHARRLEELGPDAVGRSVMRRVEGLGAAAVAVARALAVLAEPSPAPVVAAVAGLDEAVTLDAAAALMRAELLAPDQRLDFAHPIVGASISERLGPAALAELHAKAAAVLARGGRDPDRVAAHIVRVPPGLEAGAALGDVGPLLLDAARRVLARGAPEAAAGFLERALREELPEDDRRFALLTLARAELRTLGHDAVPRYEAAMEAASDSAQRARIGLELVHALPFAGLFDEAAAMAERMLELPELPEDARAELEAELLGCLSMDLAPPPDLQPRLEDLVARVASGEATSPAQRAVAGHVLVASGRDVAAGAQLAASVIEDPSLHAPGGTGLLGFAAMALLSSDRAGELAPLFDRILGDAARAGSQRAAIWASAMRGLLLSRQGDLRAANADLRTVQALWTGHEPWATRAWLVAPAVATFAECGNVDAAQRLLAEHAPPEPWPTLFQFALLRHARGVLALRSGRPADGLLDLLVLGDLAAGPSLMPDALPWRSAAALCYRALGDAEGGRALADEELRLAREAGVKRAIGRALVASALCRGGDECVEGLREAVDVLSRTDAQLELARAEVELGAALRRSGARVEAREVLRVGLDRASRCGAEPLLEHGREELVAAGARPRRERIGGVESLTASERRVVDLAAAGATNREIAQQLFLTQKTVETHLSSAYRKLDISSRGQLRDVLAAA